jgi:1-acyl-sn-glycerol-3-phosphate acyltransferase
MGSKSPFGGSEFAYRVIRDALFITYKTLFRFKVFGAEKVPQPTDGRGVILAPNHASFLDPPLTGISLKRRVTYLAKDYLFKHGFVGWVLRSVGAYPIKSESASDFKSIRDLIRILKQGACVTVFPEGTRSEDGQFRAPEGGVGFLAMKSGAWVVPIYIKGSYEAFPKGAKNFKCKPIEVHYGEPFVPAERNDWGEGEAGYMAVSQRIMADIQSIKNNLGHQVTKSPGHQSS